MWERLDADVTAFTQHHKRYLGRETNGLGHRRHHLLPVPTVPTCIPSETKSRIAEYERPPPRNQIRQERPDDEMEGSETCVPALASI